MKTIGSDAFFECVISHGMTLEESGKNDGQLLNTLSPTFKPPQISE